MMPSKSPLITKAKWGTIAVEGYQSNFRDVKLFPGGAREWDWRETGTHHQPGIQPADIEELIKYQPSVVVLASGYWERLQTMDETKKHLDQHNIPFHILETGKAVQLYNEFVDQLPVAGLIHSTC